MKSVAAPLVRIEMIQRSLRCFFLGLFGLLIGLLVPVIGIPLTLIALRQSRRVRQIGNGHWNPADRYFYWGVVFIRLGLVLIAIELTAVAAILTIELR